MSGPGKKPHVDSRERNGVSSFKYKVSSHWHLSAWQKASRGQQGSQWSTEFQVTGTSGPGKRPMRTAGQPMECRVSRHWTSRPCKTTHEDNRAANRVPSFKSLDISAWQKASRGQQGSQWSAEFHVTGHLSLAKRPMRTAGQPMECRVSHHWTSQPGKKPHVDSRAPNGLPSFTSLAHLSLAKSLTWTAGHPMEYRV